MSKNENALHEQQDSQVHQSTLRPTVQVQLPDGRVFEFMRGAPLVDVLRLAYDEDRQPVAAVIDGILVESSRPLDWDVAVKPVFLTDSDGSRI